MHRLSLRRMCLTLTLCNSVAIVFEANSGWLSRQVAPSLSSSWPSAGIVASNFTVAFIIIFVGLWVSALTCFAVLAPAPGMRRLPPLGPFRGRIWLTVANLMVLGIETFVPHITR